jgi:chitinase
MLSDASPSFTADVAGIYVATLIVSDGKVGSLPATVEVTAIAP